MHASWHVARCRRMAVGTVLCLFAAVPPAGAMAAEPPLRVWASSVVTIEAQGGGAAVVASGVVVSAAGHVVTAWSPLRGARRVRLLTHDGRRHDVLGVVAADRRLDLVVLAMKRGADMPPPAALVDRAVDVGETVHAIAGPGAEPAIAATDRVDAIESGARYRRALPPQTRGTVAPEQCRIVHHAYLGAAARGGALFGDDGRLLGVLVAAADWDDRVHVAVHAGHVRELLDHVVAPRALPRLADAERTADPASVRDDARRRAERFLPAVDGDVAALPGTLRDLLAAHRANLAALSDERRRVAARDDGWRVAARVPEEAFEEVQRRITVNRVAFTTMEPEDQIESVVTLPDGMIRRMTQQVFSPRQMLVRQELDRECLVLQLELGRIHGERLRWQSLAEQTQRDLAALDRMAATLEVEVFFAGDPLGMRGDDEIDAANAELDAEIAAGGRVGVFVLLRGLSHTRLRRFDEAIADFDRVIEDDRVWRPAATLARARTEARRRGASSAAAVARAAREGAGDPIIDTLLARCAIDAGDWRAADTRLQSALRHGGDPLHLHSALARVALAPEGRERHPRRAREHAHAVCLASSGRDWRGWGLDALATAAAGDWDEAERRLSAAEAIVEPPARDPFRTWQTAIDQRRMPIDWFTP